VEQGPGRATILTRQAPRAALRYAGEIVSLPRVLPYVLDPSPLEGNLDRWIDWHALRRGVAERRLEAIAVVATAARSGRSVRFCDDCLGRPPRCSPVIG
jgi:NTE family protein